MRPIFGVIIIVGIAVAAIGLIIDNGQKKHIEYESNTWYMNATIIDKQIHWYGNDCVFLGSDNKRYSDICSDLDFVGDHVSLRMNKKYVSYVDKNFDR